jgi:glycosyltransferase involved in cell wall biosynthesis
VHRGIKPNAPELLRLFGESDIFVLPTRGDCLPLVGLEALSSGLPLVVTRVGGLPDLVREGETGLTLAVDDADALGDALEQLTGDAALRARMSQAARTDALARFDAVVTSKALFDFVLTRI